MIKFSEVEFDEFQDLVEFLKFNDEDSEIFNITQRLRRFIKDMTAMQTIIINNIIDSIFNKDIETAKREYKSFHIAYPETMFDTEGKLDLTKIDYFEVKLQSCEVLFERAKNILERNAATNKLEYNVHKQIYNAKTLEPLISMTRRI